MVTSALRSLWAEPRPARAPGPRPRDRALVAALVGWSVLEVVLRQDLAPLPLLVLATVAVLAPLLWRRTHPLVAVAVAFGTLTVVDTVRIVTGPDGFVASSLPQAASRAATVTDANIPSARFSRMPYSSVGFNERYSR